MMLHPRLRLRDTRPGEPPPYLGFSPSMRALDTLTNLIFRTVIATAGGLLQGTGLAGLMGPLGAWASPRNILGYLNPFRAVGLLTGWLARGVAVGIPMTGYRWAHAVAPVVRQAAPAVWAMGTSFAGGLRRLVIGRDPHGRRLENLFTGRRIRPAVGILAEAGIFAGAALSAFSGSAMLPPTRVVQGELPFMLQDAMPDPFAERPNPFDALQYASLPFALHRLRHG